MDQGQASKTAQALQLQTLSSWPGCYSRLSLGIPEAPHYPWGSDSTEPAALLQVPLT